VLFFTYRVDISVRIPVKLAIDVGSTCSQLFA